MKGLCVCIAVGLLAVLPAHSESSGWYEVAAEPSTAAIQVFQESSPGRGDFAEQLLGDVVPFAADTDATQLYGYRAQEYQGNVELSQNRSHLFFAETAEGLVLVIIHDDGAAGNRGGRAGLTIDVQGPSPAVLVEDDPVQGADDYVIDGNRITMHHGWIDGHTDGAVIGPFTGNVITLDVMFAVGEGRRVAIEGLESWSVLTFDTGQSSVDLALEEERRVRFVIVGNLDALNL